MKRFFQVMLIVSTAGLSWLVMMAVHEFGHVVNAWLSGGTVERVVVHPLAFSRTDVAPNPHPLFVAWGGAIWGCLIPLTLWALARIVLPRVAYLMRWLAGFCLIANGAYLAVGSLLPDGDDAGTMLRHGAAQWQILIFALPAAAVGLYLWNGLGPHFGLGSTRGNVDRSAAVAAAVALAALVIVELSFGG